MNIIEIKHVTKAYKIYSDNKDRLLESLPLMKKRHTNFYVLKDINLTIKKGEIVGIVGSNGAGKSTLLKIITGVSFPTEGTLSVHGKIASLLELGTGFDPELTGIENIYFQGHLMGFSEKEIDAKMEEIVAFADIGDFLTQPVKNYSSGMFARLAFSTAINVEPDILIVDEVLSVGDMRFQLKCLQKIEEMGAKGTTILFVSHDTHSVARYCQRVVWIKDNEVFADGASSDIIPLFRDYMIFGDVSNSITLESEQKNWQIPEELLDENAKIVINKFLVPTVSGTCINHRNETLEISLSITANHPVSDLYISTLITDHNSYPLAHQGFSYKRLWKKGETREMNIVFDMPSLKNGEYAISFDIGDISSGEFELCLKLNNAYIFSVHSNEDGFDGDGVLRLDNYRIEEK